MTSLDVAAVATALSNAAATLTTPKALNCFPYPKLTAPVPSFQVFERTAEFDASMGRSVDKWLINCRVYAASASDDRDGAALLDAYLKPDGPTSIRQVLTQNGGATVDRTLGGVCQSMRVVKVDGYAVYMVNDVGYLGATFTVEVY